MSDNEEKDRFRLALSGAIPVAMFFSAMLIGWNAVMLCLCLASLAFFFLYEPSDDFTLGRAVILFQKERPPLPDGRACEFFLTFGGLRMDGKGTLYGSHVPWKGVVLDTPDKHVWARGLGVVVTAGHRTLIIYNAGPFCWGFNLEGKIDDGQDRTAGEGQK